MVAFTAFVAGALAARPVGHSEQTAACGGVPAADGAGGEEAAGLPASRTAGDVDAGDAQAHVDVTVAVGSYIRRCRLGQENLARVIILAAQEAAQAIAKVVRDGR